MIEFGAAGLVEAFGARGGADAGNDLDGDGLTNLQEFQNGSDPESADTDGDGLSDGDEVNLYGSSPARVDSDSDFINDPQEISIGTDPANPDSDSGGELDGLELINNQDPAGDGSDDLAQAQETEPNDSPISCQ